MPHISSPTVARLLPGRQEVFQYARAPRDETGNRRTELLENTSLNISRAAMSHKVPPPKHHADMLAA
jgi:hypothetical protein